MPIANDFISNLDEDVYRFELSTSFCDKCFTFQIGDQPDPSQMFHDHYPFFTGLSKAMTTHFDELVELHTLDPIIRDKDFFVVEIGSNDGTLLEALKKREIHHLGVDPSSNVVASATAKGLQAVVAFFGEKTSQEISNEFGSADRIMAANVICHIPDLNDFGRGVKQLLKQDGEFIFEEPYIGSMLEKTSYDQIYDEHVFIFGLHSVREIFKRVGLELVDVIPQVTHGGSMRYVLTHTGYRAASSRLNQLLLLEVEQGLTSPTAYQDFARKCFERKKELKMLLESLQSEGKKVAGYAATSKSTTVLNFCEINSDLIEYISDSTPQKIGKFTPGSHIPIISHDEMRSRRPDFLVLFGWNHESEILAKEKDLTKAGTKWIRFVPDVEVL
jgi:methylation protein EvaC